jgi:hypothetical protein
MLDMRPDFAPGQQKFQAIQATTKWPRTGVQKPAVT